ncbi:MAG: hypothetical protein Tp1125DCM238401_38 [Prokaryotic dsDNA virus sp.]|nr:MAG: hypothetical protein Tp1125DCM238401_38 [Prokaryotic dsDNA virus sp.]
MTTSTYDIEVPAWIDDEYFSEEALSDSSHEDHEDEVSTLRSIVQGGCASGAYMPAVTYYKAKQTMTEHGEEVLDYIVDAFGELPAVSLASHGSWASIGCHYLSFAVELWAGLALRQIDPDF